MTYRTPTRGIWAMVLALFVATACSDSGTDPVPSEINILDGDIEMVVGESHELEVEIEGSSDDPTFTSTNTDVATVTSSGRVDANAAGFTTVTAAVNGAEDDIRVTVVEPPAPVEVTLNPAEATLTEGATMPLVAEVKNAEDDAVTFESSDSSVASVDEEGVVSAEAAGIAIITARSVEDESASAQSEITVTDDPMDQVTVSFGSITDPTTGASIDLDDVMGRMDVNLNVDVPSGFTGHVNLYLADEKVSGQTIGQFFEDAEEAAAASEAQVTYTINTAAYDEVGTPRFLNGVRELRAEVVSSSGKSWEATEPSVVLNNTDAVHAEFQVDGASAMDPSGILWRAGDAEARAFPVMYSGEEVASLQIGLCGAATMSREAVEEDGVFRAVFSAESEPTDADDPGVEGVEGELELCNITTVTAAGEVGPSAIANDVSEQRIDNAAPEFTETYTLDLGSQYWINGEFAFDEESFPAWTDEGVGGVTCTTFAGPVEDDDSWNVVVIGDDLPNSETNNAYWARVTCADRLGNSASQYLVDGLDEDRPFGVDKTPPLLAINEDISVEAEAINPVGSIYYEGVDEGPGGPSGLGEDFFRHLVLIDQPGISEEDRCPFQWDSAEEECAYTASGDASDGGEWEIEADATLGVEGYFTFKAYVQDRARNDSEIVTRTVLHDQTAPTLGNITVPALEAGESASFSINAEDNIDLHRATYWVEYGTAQLALSGGDVVEGEPFSGDLTESATFTQEWSRVIGSVESVNASHEPNSVFVTADEIVVRVHDAAGNPAQNAASLTGNIAGIDQTSMGASSMDDDQVYRFELMEIEDDVCVDEQGCEEVEDNILITLEVDGETEVFSDIFAEVRFLVRDTDGMDHVIPATPSVTVSDDGTTRTYSYVIDWTPGLDYEPNTLQVHAMGILEDGRAIMTNEGYLEFVTD